MSTNVVGSNLSDTAADQLKPSSRNYGQNGFAGPSSDTPGNRTASGFLPGPGTPINDQLRNLKGAPLPAAFGMKKPDAKSL